jgi:hypothetical protein
MLCYTHLPVPYTSDQANLNAARLKKIFDVIESGLVNRNNLLADGVPVPDGGELFSSDNLLELAIDALCKTGDARGCASERRSQV